MATLESRLVSLAQTIGADVKALRAADGNLASLSTTAKSSLVAAINELYTLLGSSGATIDDEAGNGATSVVWSADKTYDEIALAKTEVIDQLTAGASAALDTLAELAAAINNDASYASTVATALGLRVRVDAEQTFDGTQQTQGRANIGAASAAALSTLTTNVGDTDRNLVTDYTTARDS
jgi:hypothetical protein